MALSRFSFPTDIRFGAGARHELPGAVAARGLRRPLVITDRGVAMLPQVQEMVANLRAAGLAVMVFADVQGNPTVPQVTSGVTAFSVHRADVIIGIGGGAALDVAKAVALMSAHPGELFAYEDGRADALPIDREIPWIIAVPTTAGTGSEVGRSAVIADPVSHVKRIIFSPRLLAKQVFADPELTLALPKGITAATGMDALTHCIEAFLAREFHPICDGIALEGVRIAAQTLARCCHHGGDVAARSQMLLVSMMGAIAFQKGLGVTHSCAHALSAVCDMHHGLANGVMIDHALAHNLAGVPDRFARLAHAAGLADETGPAFLRYLTALKADIGIPATLRAAAVDPRTMPDLVAAAMADSCHQSNPVACTQADFERIFRTAFGAA